MNNHESVNYEYNPRSRDGEKSNSNLDPRVKSLNGQQAVSTLLDRQTYTTNDAFDLLHDAAQH